MPKDNTDPWFREPVLVLEPWQKLDDSGDAIIGVSHTIHLRPNTKRKPEENK
jgi:hypothetical protein